MAYNTIRSAAYVLDHSAGPFTEVYYALAFPDQWRQPILDLYQHGWRNPDPHAQVPIRRLNGAIRAVAPDLVSVAERATIDSTKPWLYTTSEYPLSVVSSLIVSWLYTLRSAAGDFPLVRDTVQRLDLRSLNWNLMSVDLTDQTLSHGGTAIPAPHLHRLLPEVLAARIEQLPPYEYCGTQVAFRRVATREGAELMSWPPSVYLPKPPKGRASRPWHFSAVIKVTLQTVPFSPVPRIHLSTGIRRWMRGSVFVPDDRGVTTYLLADGPWLTGAGNSARFAAAKLVWSWKDRKATWAVGGPEGILSRLTTAREFPPPDVLVKEPETWLGRRDGVTAAVTYHTTMGHHGVKSGLMPSERQRLTQWAAQAILPHFQPAGDMSESQRTQTLPRRVLEKRPQIPRKDATPEQVAAAMERRAEVDVVNARRRREYLARAVGDDHVLTCHVLYQTETVRDELFRAAERSLDLGAYLAKSDSDTRVWRAPGLEVSVRARPLGEFGAPLGGGTVPKRGIQHQEAVSRRRREVRQFLASLPDTSQIVFVELEGKDAFRARTTDPKFAIRLGCADADRVSQFITPEKQAKGDSDTDPSASGDDGEEGKLEYRADAAWADGLRQVGTSFVPQHTLGEAIPERLNQLAFWIVRRNSTATSWNKQFTPIAILIRPDQDCTMGRAPGMQAWVAYPELLKSLTGLVQGQDVKTSQQQKAETARFIRQVLFSLRGEPTVVLARAQNIRGYWEWLKNTQLSSDKIQMGEGPVQGLALHGKHLRLIRIRDEERNETAQWWAPVDDEIAGTSKGLWIPVGAPEKGNRVFYATTAKASTHQGRRDETKLTPRPGGKARPDKNAWNPTLLEITVAGCIPGDDAEAWAMFVQQQRVADDYKNALKYPLVLHLAELACEYALPYDDEVLVPAEQDTEADDSHTAGDEDDPE